MKSELVSYRADQVVLDFLDNLVALGTSSSRADAMALLLNLGMLVNADDIARSKAFVDQLNQLKENFEL